MILRNKTDCARGDFTNNNTDDKSLFCVSIYNPNPSFKKVLEKDKLISSLLSRMFGHVRIWLIPLFWIQFHRL